MHHCQEAKLGDVGIVIEGPPAGDYVDCVFVPIPDLNLASLVEICGVGDEGNTFTFTVSLPAGIDPATGIPTYTTLGGDLPTCGRFRLETHVVTPSVDRRFQGGLLVVKNPLC